jgi:hypothetical protein
VAGQKWLDSTRVSLCRPLLANLPSGVQAVTSRPSKAARTAAAAPQISGNKTKIGRKQYRNNKVNLQRTAGAPSISNNSSSSAAAGTGKATARTEPHPQPAAAQSGRATSTAPRPHTHRPTPRRGSCGEDHATTTAYATADGGKTRCGRAERIGER